jgi:hypothetical protein
MGAWDIGVFDNDDARDWVWTLERAENISILEKAFSVVTDEKEYLEAPDCSVALAAAETIAAMRGKPANNLPPDVLKFAEHFHAELTDDLVKIAQNAVRKISVRSELQELWDESENREEWHNVLAELLTRL